MEMKEYIHIAIVILASCYFLFRFIKDRYIYELLFVIWIPSTLLPYFFVGDVTATRIIGYAQMVMFILVIFFMFRKRADRRIKTLSMLAQMSADSLPFDDEPVNNTAPLENKNTQQVEQDKTI